MVRTRIRARSYGKHDGCQPVSPLTLPIMPSGHPQGHDNSRLLTEAEVVRGVEDGRAFPVSRTVPACSWTIPMLTAFGLHGEPRLAHIRFSELHSCSWSPNGNDSEALLAEGGR